jgi:hypothetical protein
MPIDISSANEWMVKNSNTKCRFTFKEGAETVMYCPKGVKTKELVLDLKGLTSILSWPMPIFDVFDSQAATPKSWASFLALPGQGTILPHQIYSIQIINGVAQVTCGKGGKEVKCKP